MLFVLSVSPLSIGVSPISGFASGDGVATVLLVGVATAAEVLSDFFDVE